MLEKDILNIPYHILGQHNNYDKYFKQKCNSTETNIFEQVRLEKSHILEKFTGIIKSIVSKSNSLIFDVDKNVCEQFHNNVAKCVGGKRVNFTLSNSYEARTMAAIIQHNTGRVHSAVHEQVFRSSANMYISVLEESRRSLNKSNQKKMKEKVQNKKNFKYCGPDKNYGTETCEKPDLPYEEYQEKKQLFLDQLEELQRDRLNIMEITKDQSSNNQWYEIRKKMLTSSNFGVICKRRKDDCSKLVKSLLYSKELNTLAINKNNLNETAPAI